MRFDVVFELMMKVWMKIELCKRLQTLNVFVLFF